MCFFKHLVAVYLLLCCVSLEGMDLSGAVCEDPFSLVVDAFISELSDRNGMQNEDSRASRKLLCRVLLQRYVRELVKTKGVCEKLCSQIRAKAFKEYTSSSDIKVLQKKAIDVVRIFGEQSVWSKSEEKQARETPEEQQKRKQLAAQQPGDTWWYDVPDDSCLGGHEKYQGGCAGAHCGVAEYICNKINSEQSQDRYEVLEYLYNASLDLLKNNDGKQEQVFALLVIMYWVDEQSKEHLYKVFYNHLRLLCGRGFLYADDVALTLFELYKEDEAMRSSVLGMFNDALLNGYALDQNLVSSELDCCQRSIGDCTTINYDNVEDKKTLLREVESLVLAGYIDCGSAFSFLQKVVIYELGNCKKSDDGELGLLRAELTITLLKSYIRNYNYASVDELETVCQLMASEFSTDRSKAAVHLYYLSLQLLRDNNTEEISQFAMLTVFYWISQQPVEQWYKVFNNHLQLLVSRQYVYGQGFALELFKAYRDIDSVRFFAITLFAQLYLEGYQPAHDIKLSALEVVSGLVCESDEEVAIECGMPSSSDAVASFARNTIKVSSSVLAMLEAMVVAGFEPAFFPALMAAKRACLTYAHNPSYRIEGIIVLEKYRLQGFYLLKQLALRGFSCIVIKNKIHPYFLRIIDDSDVFKYEFSAENEFLREISITQIINESKKASYVKVLSTFEWIGSDYFPNYPILHILKPDEIEFHEKCSAVIALRDEVEAVLAAVPVRDPIKLYE